MMSEESLIFLPSITIQHDLPEVINDIKNDVCSAEDVWISCYRSIEEGDRSTKKSVHGKVRLTSSNDYEDELPELHPREGIECEWLKDSQKKNGKRLLISCESLKIPSTILSFPSKVLKNVQIKGIDCMDVSGDWIVTGGKSGSLRIDNWIDLPETSDVQDSKHHLLGKGHLSDLTTCKFLPSGEVVLTTSIDMSARLFSIFPDPNLPPQSSLGSQRMFNPRTFSVPHGRAITASGIIDRGKEIVTACRDGKLRIWNVSESRVIRESDWPGSGEVDVVEISVGRTRKVLGPPNGRPIEIGSERIEEEDPQKFLVLGLSSGSVNFVNVSELEPIKLNGDEPVRLAEPISSMRLSDESDILAIGSSFGTITLFTLTWQRNEEDDEDLLSVTKMFSWRRNRSRINCLYFSKSRDQSSLQTLLVAGDDGLPYRCKITPSVIVLEEFGGFDCDPVTAIVEDHESRVFISGQDGSVKIYNV